MRINRYSLVPLPGIPSDHQVSKIMVHAMVEGARTLEEALELGRNAAYDSAWPMLVIDRDRGAVSHKIGVIGRIEEVSIPASK